MAAQGLSCQEDVFTTVQLDVVVNKTNNMGGNDDNIIIYHVRMDHFLLWSSFVVANRTKVYMAIEGE
eukprot:4760704-Ditylum_brightwellii.AAC.1